MSASELPILILGAGFSGIASAIQLEKAGIRSYTILERADEVGGTWRDNTYPGAACDVPSHVYSLSFEPNPDWSRRYATSGEIQRYLVGLVEKWGLRKRLRTGCEVREARFDEAQGEWEVEITGGERLRARAVISCVGGLVEPQFPEIPGIRDYQGELMHTARWNHDLSLAGRKVAVIGTGASAVQTVPAIAPEVEQLSVFQRTPAWVVPKLDHEYSPERRRRYERWPSLQRLSRLVKYGLSELRGPIIFLDAPRLSARGETMSRAHLEAQVQDPILREQLMPKFQFGCKRILISDDYWSSFERDNVELVTNPIESFTPSGLRTRDGREHAFDVVIAATGFDITFDRAAFPIYGRGGRSLSEVWKAGASAYKGVSVAGFPNWFILLGPNTAPGHTSVLVYTEAQVAHIVGAMRALGEPGVRSVEVRQEVQDAYDASLQRRMPYMVWNSGCNSWYLSEGGENHSLFPGFAAEYALRTRRFRRRDYVFD